MLGLYISFGMNDQEGRAKGRRRLASKTSSTNFSFSKWAPLV